MDCRNTTNLQFADDIDAPVGEEQRLEALSDSLNKTCTRYKMDISVEKTELMTIRTNGIQREIKMKEQKQALNTFEQLFQIMAQNQRCFQGLNKPLQLLQS